MSDDKFDAIVVGAGVAGSVAALVMARAGLDVLVIERGDSAGCKNMTGGRLYAHTLEAIIPGFAASAPVERKVTREKISFLTEESAVTLDFHREQPDVPQHASYTVLRNRLDPWLMEQAEQAGAQFIPGVRVDALVREGNKVTGVHIRPPTQKARSASRRIWERGIRLSAYFLYSSLLIFKGFSPLSFLQ